jgi:hypothetical protein
MKIQITESCAGTAFFYKRGDIAESDAPEIVERFKDLVKAGHAIELEGGKTKTERASQDLGKIEKR